MPRAEDDEMEAGAVNKVCQNCRYWAPYTVMMSHDGMEFEIGHCEPIRIVGDDMYAVGYHCGLTADNYGCSEFSQK